MRLKGEAVLLWRVTVVIIVVWACDAIYSHRGREQTIRAWKR